MSEKGVLADAGSLGVKDAFLIYCSANELVADGFVYRQTFPGSHRFIDTALALNHFAVSRGLLPRTHDIDIANPHLG